MKTKVFTTTVGSEPVALTAFLIKQSANEAKGQFYQPKVNVCYGYPECPGETVPNEVAAAAWDKLTIEVINWASKNGAKMGAY